MQVLRYPSSVDASPGRWRFAPISTPPRPRKKPGMPSRHSQASGVYARFSPSNKTRQSGRNSSTRNAACPVGVGSLEPATTLVRIACSTESDTATEWPGDQSLASGGTQINWVCPPHRRLRAGRSMCTCRSGATTRPSFSVRPMPSSAAYRAVVRCFREQMGHVAWARMRLWPASASGM